MRVLLFSILLTILPSVLLGQTEQPDIEGQVQNAWRHLSQEGLYTSWDTKYLGRLGDASAVALTKIIGGKALDERDIEAALAMIQMSYEDPRLVSNYLDRQPRTTFFVLRYLHLATNNTKLKEKIANIESYVNDRYTKSMLEPHNPNSSPPQ